MKVKIFFCFILAITLGHNTRAESFEVQTLNNKDQMIYEETKQVCAQNKSILNIIGNKNTLDAFLISTGQSLNLMFSASSEEIQKISNQNMLSDYTIDRLTSDGFIQAIYECYPNSEKMRSSFVISMMGADILGKVPSVLAVLSLFNISKIVGTKISMISSNVYKYLMLTSTLSAVIYAVIDTRTKLKNHELSDFEKQRLEKITSNMRENRSATKSLVIEMALDEISFQEEAFVHSNSPEERIQIRNHINRMRSALKKMY